MFLFTGLLIHFILTPPDPEYIEGNDIFTALRNHNKNCNRPIYYSLTLHNDLTQHLKICTDHNMKGSYQSQGKRDATAAEAGWTDQRWAQRVGVPLFNCTTHCLSLPVSFLLVEVINSPLRCLQLEPTTLALRLSGGSNTNGEVNIY